MVHFTGVETSERHQRFNTLKQEIDTVLRYPGVQEELGSLGARLLTLNDEAFLPNVNHGGVFVPRRYRDTDATALLPRLWSDGSLYLADSFFQPTPNRREKVTRALELKDGDPDSFLQRSMDIMREELSEEEEEENPLLHPEVASAGAITYFDSELDVLATSRTILTIEYDQLPGDPLLRGGIGAHEWVHIYDMQNLEVDPDIYYAMYTEFRGYRVGAVTVEAAINAGVIDAQIAWAANNGATAMMEDLRRRQKIDSAALLEGRIKPDDNRFEGAFSDMFLHGLIDL